MKYSKKCWYLYLILFFINSPLTMAKGANEFLFSLPIASVGGEAIFKGEYNLGLGGLGIELFRIERDDFSEREKKDRNGESLFVQGSEVAAYYISYGNEKKMSGGYWLLGVGFRRLETDWLEENLTVKNMDDLKYSVVASGGTFRGRIGYRYVADSFPFAMGIYIGIRHFQNEVVDHSSTSEKASIDESEAAGLQRRFTSSLEPGLEFGMVF